MNLKKSLVSIVILSIFMTGCSIENKDKNEVIADKATQQKTMTKVQNDVNEIMSKDYDYVVKNMGLPYCTTYYINLNDVKYTNTIEELNQISNVRMVYPKYTSDNKLDKSALYIELNKNKVTEVETYDFSNRDINRDIDNKNIDIIIDKYDENEKISLKDLKNINLESYKYESKDKLKDIVGNKRANLEAYNKNREESYVKSYLLKGEDTKESKVLTIFISNNKIEDIKISDKENSIDVIKSYLIN